MSGMLGKAEMDKIGTVNLIRLGLTSSRKKTLENFETYISMANNELAKPNYAQPDSFEKILAENDHQPTVNHHLVNLFANAASLHGLREYT